MALYLIDVDFELAEMVGDVHAMVVAMFTRWSYDGRSDGRAIHFTKF